MKPLWMLLFNLLFAMTAAASPNALEAALQHHFNNEVPHYLVVMHDLNGDGLQDALVYAQDPAWCGSAGCTLFVFKGSSKGYEFLSRTTIVLLPLAVINAPEPGWKPLLVYAKGMGSVILKGTDKGYPLNPSLQPLATKDDSNAAVELLSNRS